MSGTYSLYFYILASVRWGLNAIEILRQQVNFNFFFFFFFFFFYVDSLHDLRISNSNH